MSPLKPINSFIGAPTYQVSIKYLTKALRTLQVDNQYTMQNSTELAEFVFITSRLLMMRNSYPLMSCHFSLPFP